MPALPRRSLLTAGSALAASTLLGALGSREASADVRPTGSVSYPLGTIILPKSRPAWELDPARAVLLVHDMQHYFVKIYTPGADPIRTVLSNTRALLEAARGAGVPVLYSGQPGGMTREQRGLFFDLYGSGMPDDDAERAIVAPLEPLAEEPFLTKWKISAFFRTGLLDVLQSLGRDQLVVSGVYAFSGVTITSMDAIQNDIQPFIVSDAVADYDLDGHQQALDWCAASTSRVLSARSALAVLRQ